MRSEKKICLFLAFLMLATLLVSCGDGDKVAYPLPETEPKETVLTEPPHETADNGGFTHLIRNGLKYYRVIYPEDAEGEIIEAAERLKSAVSVLTGEELVVRSDAADFGDGHEILIGRTNREDSRNALGEVDFLTFCVRATDENIVIVGSNDRMTCLGIEWFVENCIEGNLNNIGEGFWRIENGLRHVSSPAPYLPENFINAEGEYFLEEESAFNVPCEAENGILRGSCTDGRYYYCAFEVNEDGNCVIYKIDPDNGETVKVGREIRGLRAVDMTFDTERNRIVAVDYSDGRSGIAVIDPNSLDRVQRYDVGENISAVAYVERTNSFLMLNEERTALLNVSSGFKLQSREDFDVSGSCGFDADSSFIYICESLGGLRVIRIYSHGGELVNEIGLAELDASPRSLAVSGATLLLGYDTYFRGADIYEFSVKVSEKSA